MIPSLSTKTTGNGMISFVVFIRILLRFVSSFICILQFESVMICCGVFSIFCSVCCHV